MFKFFKQKIARKLIAAIAVLVIIIFMVTGFVIYNNMRTELVENIERDIILNSEIVVKDISSIFVQNKTITEQMGTNNEVKKYLKEVNSREEITAHPQYYSVSQTLNNIKDSNDLLSGIWIANYETNFAIDNTGFISNDEFDVKTRPWYNIVNTTEGVGFTNPYVDLASGKTMVSGVQAIWDNNKIIGAVSSDIALDSIPGIMEESKIGEKGKNILVSSEGTYIYTEDSSKIINEKATDDSVLKDYVKAALIGESDIKDITYDGEEYYLAYEPISINGWAVISLVNKAEMMASLNSAMLELFISFLVGCLVLIFLSYFIVAKNMKPIEIATKHVKTMANGDFTMNVPEAFLKRIDEVGGLAEGFDILTNNMNDVMSNISVASEQVASGSRQVSDSSITLSQGATEQASSVEQLTASIEEIAAQTKQNAQNANEVKNIAETGKEHAINGNAQMKEMLNAMVGINESSNNISKIIKVIDEIAFQTNILALNAAVEAARAGQHGKGFAVVAEEVRNLAARSANAAKETTTMIEDSIRKVEDGTKIAEITAEALDNIVDGVTRTATLIEDIAVASNEQAIGIEQINGGVSQIATVIQTTSATSEEAAAASEELSSQAEMLKSQVSTFKLKSNSDTLSYESMENLNPEVLKVIESMNTNGATIEPKNIELNDMEFGKY